jgi:hypothetical protein
LRCAVEVHDLTGDTDLTQQLGLGRIAHIETIEVVANAVCDIADVLFVLADYKIT